ncbi:MAG: hypothetical protein HYY93_01185 [Planctomycetes bacterium]|nr:hypothetical protein [Planctomycetota bacterium]
MRLSDSTRFRLGLAVSIGAAAIAFSCVPLKPQSFLDLGEHPPCGDLIPWWLRPPCVAGILLAWSILPFLFVHRRLKQRVLLSVPCSLALLIGVAWGLRFSADHTILGEQSCFNCRNFTHFAFDQYASSHEGWYPRGGRDEWDSLARAFENEHDVHFFTSHVLARAAEAHWQSTRSLTEDLCCYRYNEGLREDDPAGLILMYYASAGDWECCCKRAGRRGRVCWRVNGSGTEWRWQFLNEDEFQRVQAQTLSYLAGRRTVRERENLLLHELRFVLDRSPLEDGGCELKARIVNEGAVALSITALDRCTTQSREGGGFSSSGIFSIDSSSFTLEPGASRALEGHCRFNVSDGPSGAGDWTRTLFSLHPGGNGTSTRSFPATVTPDEANREYWMDVWIHLRVEDLRGGDAIDLTLRAPRAYYLIEPSPR